MTQHHPEQSFPVFWAAYPRHIARKQALKAWIALDPDEALVNVILAALVWQTPLWPDLQFCPHAATYLRSERWMDERPQPTSVIDQLPAWQRRSLFLNRQTH